MTDVDDRDLETLRAVLSHDVAAVLRTATSMLGYLDELPEPQRAEVATLAAGSIGGAERVVRQALDLLAIVRGFPSAETVELDEVVAECQATVGADVEVPAPLGTVQAPRVAWRIILLELVSNAHRYAGGTVTLRRDDDVLCVLDQGPGIAAGDLERVFEPGTRTSTAVGHGPGAGIGLHLARRAAQAIGAQLHLESRDPSGTRAVVRLPSAEDEGGPSGA